MINWEQLTLNHNKISFEYNGKTITGVVNYYFDEADEYDEDPDERIESSFTLKGSKVAKAYNIREVSNVKILD
ncbi:hypothetical protein IV73_GL000164 [Weissella kandleri]|uniref:Uncharacterized protein n=1 Tax=Weissella kandleri TaxID=1616 RepID=A0A0R2JIG3_9LACO|nr:hypothetical protein [Weissella kandleri]KRN75670.1 hypothetical protein IV73_GL000164 [Weissella kandleri]